MTPVLLGVGMALVLLAVIETVWTTLWTDGGAGPLTDRLASTLWWLARVVLPRDSHTALSLYAPVILICMVGLWVLLLWAGWALVFASTPGAVVNATTRVPAGAWDIVYFSAYTIFTLGLGDFVPTGPPWEVATGVAAGTGLIFITIAVTFLISVLSAVANKRAFGMRIAGLGATPAEVVANGWEGHGFGALTHELQNVSSQLTVLAEQHMAYPVLHYYHAREVSRASLPALSVLDDALNVLEHGVGPAARPPMVVLRGVRSSVTNYMDAVGSVFRTSPGETPDIPALDAVRAAGVPCVPEERYRTALTSEELARRRQVLKSLLEADAWRWEALAEGACAHEGEVRARGARG